MVVEPGTLLGVGIGDVLDLEDDIEVVAAQLRSPADAIQVVGATAPDVILVNLPSELRAAAEIARQLRREMPEAVLILMGGEDDDASIVEALEVRATARVAEFAEPAELVATIHRVAEGDFPLKDELSARPDLIARIVDAVHQSMVAEVQPVSPLSPRELEVLQLVARGDSNLEIAAQLGISDQTVKNHITSILHKLGVPNRTRAVIYAVRQGWLALDGAPVTESEGARAD
jgi:DNA-binding NarL/FixJ family response regulator